MPPVAAPGGCTRRLWAAAPGGGERLGSSAAVLQELTARRHRAGRRGGTHRAGRRGVSRPALHMETHSVKAGAPLPWRDSMIRATVFSAMVVDAIGGNGHTALTLISQST